MAKGWKCPHCSTENPETTLTCTGCGRIQGSVVVPGSPPVTPATSTPLTGTPGQSPIPPSGEPSEGWQAASSGWSSGVAPGGPAGAPSDPDAAPGNAPVGTPSWAVNLDTVPPASTPRWRRLPIGGILVVALVIAVSVGGYIFSAGRSSTGEINRSGDMTANDLRVGDCFDLKEPDAEEVGDVTARPCTEAHEYEVFYVGDMASGPYPGEEAFTGFMVDNCEPAFGSYVGKAYADSQLDFFWLYPSDESWGDGDRSVQCAAYDPENSRLTATIKGSAQ